MAHLRQAREVRQRRRVPFSMWIDRACAIAACARRSARKSPVGGGLQPEQTILIRGQYHAAGICIEIKTANQDRMRPETNRLIAPINEGKSALRSSGHRHWHQKRIQRVWQPLGNRICLNLNGYFRDRLLDGEIIYSLAGVQIIGEKCSRHYNAKGPHYSVSYQSPAPAAIVQMDQKPLINWSSNRITQTGLVKSKGLWSGEDDWSMATACSEQKLPQILTLVIIYQNQKLSINFITFCEFTSKESLASRSI